jgi:hypothetical protein
MPRVKCLESNMPRVKCLESNGLGSSVMRMPHHPLAAGRDLIAFGHKSYPGPGGTLGMCTRITADLSPVDCFTPVYVC